MPNFVKVVIVILLILLFIFITVLINKVIYQIMLKESDTPQELFVKFIESKGIRKDVTNAIESRMEIHGVPGNLTVFLYNTEPSKFLTTDFNWMDTKFDNHFWVNINSDWRELLKEYYKLYPKEPCIDNY